MTVKFFPLIVLAFLVFIPMEIVSTQSGEWLSIENEYFIINYKEGYISDAELILDYSQFARNVTMEIYPHILDTKVTVYLYDFSSWTRTPYEANADPTNAVMYFLTPSDVPESAKDEVNNLWYQKNVVHEYVHIPTLRDLRKTTHYYYFGAPSWLTEGVAEYIAVFRTTDDILQKYPHYATEMLGTLCVGSLYFGDYNMYHYGAYVMKYVYETYGEENTALLFKIDTEFLWDAINQTLGVSRSQFEQKWVEWIYAECNLALPTECLEKEELGALYTKLQQEYGNLENNYLQLNATHYRVLEDFDTLHSEDKYIQSNYYSLNSTYQKLAGDYEDIQKTVELIQIEYDKLMSNYNAMKSDSESAIKELENTKSEAATNKNLVYSLIATLAFVIAVTYIIIRKKVITQKRDFEPPQDNKKN